MLANVRVRPSAPLPVSIVASKPTVSADEVNAVGQKPEPAWLLAAGVSWSCPPRIDAVPFSCHPPAVGSDAIDAPPLPLPVSATICSPWPSSPVMLYEADAAPGTLGANVTVWVRWAPGARIVPSGSGLPVLNVPAGAFAFVMTSGPAPVLPTSNVNVLALPVAIVPKSTVNGVRVRWPGGTPVPVSGTVTVSPAVSLTATLPLNVPATVGAKERPIDSDPFGAIGAPTLGRPVAANGAAGGWIDWMVSVLALPL